MKYIFKQIDDISGRNAETTVEFSADSLSDILQHFEMFLRGSGFNPQGILDFIPDEEYYGELDKQEHEWTQTLRDDSEGPFSATKLHESEIKSWEGVSPSVAMQWTVNQLIKENPVCSVCKIDVETMKNHECWDKNCPKGKDAN